MVARYADACNFFGDVETIRHKVAVLEERCERIGRDPAEITKTRLGPVNIAATQAEAERNAKRVAEVRNLDPDRIRGSFITGDPDSVLEQVDAFLEAGLDGMLISLPDAHDLEPIELVGPHAGRAAGLSHRRLTPGRGAAQACRCRWSCRNESMCSACSARGARGGCARRGGTPPRAPSASAEAARRPTRAPPS